MQNHYVIFFYSVSPDTHFETDFRLTVSATELLCSSILPIVPLYSGIPCCKFSCKLIVIVYEHMKNIKVLKLNFIGHFCEKIEFYLIFTEIPARAALPLHNLHIFSK